MGGAVDIMSVFKAPRTYRLWLPYTFTLIYVQLRLTPSGMRRKDVIHRRHQLERDAVHHDAAGVGDPQPHAPVILPLEAHSTQENYSGSRPGFPCECDIFRGEFGIRPRWERTVMSLTFC